MGPGERHQLAAARLGSRRVHGHPASGSFAQLVALELKELLHTAGQLPVEASDVEVVVDVGARGAEPRQISVPGLLRWRPRGALRQQRSQPRHSRLVQHHFLQGSRLLPSILPHERSQAVRAQGIVELLRDPGGRDGVETFSAVNEEDAWRRLSLESQIQRAAHLRHKHRRTRWTFTRKVLGHHLDVEFAPGQDRRPPHAHTVPRVLLQALGLAAQVLREELTPVAYPPSLAFAGQGLLPSQ